MVEQLVDVALVRHAERPPSRATRASASSAARMARWAWWSRERAVPAGMPRVSAISDGRVPEVVVQGEDGSLLGRQPAEPAFELVPIGDAEEVVGRGRSVDRQHPKVRGPATLARRLGDADVDEQTVQPGVESVRIAEPRRSRQAITSASCRASSARSTSRRIRWAIAKSRSHRGPGSGRRTPPGHRSVPPRRDRDPPGPASRAPDGGCRPKLLVDGRAGPFILRVDPAPETRLKRPGESRRPSRNGAAGTIGTCPRRLHQPRPILARRTCLRKSARAGWIYRLSPRPRPGAARATCGLGRRRRCSGTALCRLGG